MSVSNEEVRDVTAAVVQMSSTDDVAYNLGQARRWIEAAAREGARLAVLPEYFCWIGTDERKRVALAEPFGDGPIQSALAALAHDTGVWLIGGTLPIRTGASAAGERAYNTSLLIDPDGRVTARYDKVHLFSFSDGRECHAEADTMAAGERIGHAPTPFGEVRLSVCYDLRFPELYRAPPAPDLIAVPAAFTHTTGLAHWELLLRARAVENQAYVLAAGQCGTHPNGWRTFGRSMIVGPWGDVLACVEAPEPGFALARLERAALEELRTRLPALAHRRMVQSAAIAPQLHGIAR
ncbi:carbon-nitrogen hydrolase family protein [Trinickia diaoshuihuensis]|uniref:carbon-nitrogen hydrolase family protein n=1 Tax=Trinickia diaoshuihuensis TaxID=2292265 RepID=UPI0023DDF43F|nr:carbon-nitrogen hydrolase family protein [Trinickia diaoshuihuensis]